MSASGDKLNEIEGLGLELGKRLGPGTSARPFVHVVEGPTPVADQAAANGHLREGLKTSLVERGFKLWEIDARHTVEAATLEPDLAAIT